MGDGSIRDPYRPGDTRAPGPDLEQQWVQMASREALGEAIVKANAARGREFNGRIAAELREVVLGRELEEVKAELREQRKVHARLNETIAKANADCGVLRERCAELEGELKRARRAS